MDDALGVPPSHHPAPSSGHRSLVAATVVLATLVTLAWSQEGSRRTSFESRRAALASVVADRQERSLVLEAQIAELREELAVLNAQTGGALADLGERLRALSPLAGLSAVRGPGLRVTLSDSPKADRSDPASQDFLIQDVDVQGVVNALWAAGAEAIAVNNQRLVASSAIRSAGGAVLVNFEVLTPPYAIAAIGDRGAMRASFDASETARRFRRWVEIYQLGFTVEEPGDLELAPFSGGTRRRHATIDRTP